MIKFLPKNLDLKQLLADNPPEFRYHINHFIHLCSLLYEIPAKRKDVLRKGGFVPLNSYQMKRFNNGYKKYLQCLIDNEVIECDKSYIVGEKSKCYRFTSKYQGLIQTSTISKGTLTKNLQKKSAFETNMFEKYDYLKKWFNAKLTIEYTGAVQTLMELYRVDKDLGDYASLCKLNINMVNLLKLKNQDFYFTVDSTSHRLHTNLTKFKKQLRPHILYEGKKLCNIDIQCCQPTLSLCLLEPSFYETELHSEKIRLNTLDQQLIEALPMQIIASYVKENQAKFDSYRELVLNDFYLGMAEVLKQHSVTVTDRNAVKNMIYMVMYSSNKFLGGNQGLPKRIFKEMFPEVYEVFKMYKSAGQEKLPILLQKIEATLILDKVAKTISKAEPDMPIYTIHDSIVCPMEKVDFCKEVIRKESLNYLGFQPKLNTDLWEVTDQASNTQ